MAGEIVLNGTLARPALPVAATPQLVYLLLEAAPTAAVAHVQMPVNVGFVLDRSGSMKGEKIKRLREAVRTAISLMGPQDAVSIVIFDHRYEVLIPYQHVQNPQEIIQRVMRIRESGGTRIAPGLAKALEEVAKGKNDGLTRLILLTDGQTENERDCLSVAEQAGRVGIPVTALGIGDDWNEDLLIEMSNRSGGIAEYLQRPGDISAFFQTTVQAAQSAVIQQAVMNLRLVQGVQPRSIWQVVPLIANLGYAPIADRSISVNLGELSKDERHLFLIELLVDPRSAGQYRIGQAEVVYDVPMLGLQQEKARFDVMLEFTEDQTRTQQVAPQVMNIVEKVSAHKLQTRALEDLARGDVASATQKLQGAVTRLLSTGEVDLAQTMQQEIDNLQQSGQMTSAGQKTIKFGTRKTVRLSDLDMPQS